MPGEFEYISWLRSRTPADPRVLVGPGDDAAVLRPSSRPVLVTVDMLMDGTDFHIADVGPKAAGRKAMAVNLSDIAAMAGIPTAAVVSVALPKGTGRPFAEELYAGLRGIADEFGVAVVGGDTNSGDAPLAISVTRFGEATHRGPVLRSGARPGDWLLATGPFGGSLLGHHLTFAPRVREALALHEAADLHAMIDVSDGLAADVHHLIEESRCGAILFADSIPLTDAATARSRTTGKPPLDHALGDGEDFELILAVSPADGDRLLREQPVPGILLSKLGECIDSGLWLDEAGRRRRLEPRGWVQEC
jgi:thiamine-monophosphate kinase